MLPTLRTKLKGVSSRNKPLQDILSSCSKGERVVAVEALTSGIHNTKLTLQLPDKQQRVHFYDRLDLALLLPNEFDWKPTLAENIKALNVMGYDFTEDDLELENGLLKAKETSLGYIGEKQIQVIVPFHTLLDHQGMERPSYSLQWEEYYYSPEFEGRIYFSEVTFTLTIGSRPNPFVFKYEQYIDNLEYLYGRNEGFIGAWLMEKWDELDLYDDMSLMVSSQNSPAMAFQNLKDTPNSFQLTVTGKGAPSSSGPVIDMTLLRIGRFDMLPFGERLAPSASNYQYWGSYGEAIAEVEYNYDFGSYLVNGQTPTLVEVSMNEQSWIPVYTVNELTQMDGKFSPDDMVWKALDVSGFSHTAWFSSMSLTNASVDYLKIHIRATYGTVTKDLFIMELGVRGFYEE